MTTTPAFVRSPDIMRRAGVTLAAIAVYRLGCLVPLPGVDVQAMQTLAADGGVMGLASGIERLSIFALGVVPLLSAFVVYELARLAFPDFVRWELKNPFNRSRSQEGLVVLALAFALLQGLGIAVALEGMTFNPRLVAEPGLLFRTGVVVTLVAATAFLTWLSSVITRFGIGSGFWILLAVPFLLEIPGLLGAPAGAWRADLGVGLIVPLAALAGGVVAMVTVARADPDTASNGQLVWPAVLAYTAIGWTFGGLRVLFEGDGATLNEALAPAAPFRLVLLAALIWLFFALRQSALAAPARLRFATPGALILLCLAAEVTISRLVPPPALDGASFAILIAIFLPLVAFSRRDPPPSVREA